MKKFLTVLLVIAVMFTFSFGSAFAAMTQAEYDVVVEQAADQVTALANTAYAEAVKVLPDTSIAALSVTVDADFWKAAAPVYQAKIAKLVADDMATAKAAFDTTDKTVADAVALFTNVPVTVGDMVTAITTDDDVIKAVAKAYGKDVVDDAVIALKGINTTVYSATVNETTKLSSAAMAAALINESVAAIGELDFVNAADAAAVNTLLGSLGAFGTATYNAVTGEITLEVAGSGLLANYVKATDSTYDVDVYAIKTGTQYKSQDLVTTKAESDAATALAASKAQYLAQVELNYAGYVSTDKAEANAYKAAMTEIINAAADASELTAIAADAASLAVPNASSKYVDDAALIAKLEVVAGKYIAEGYDAKAINAVVATAKVAAYKDAAAWTGYDAAEAAIKAAVLAQFDKAVIDAEVAAAELAYEAIVEAETYYAPELAQVKALYDGIAAELKACVSQAEINAVKTKYAVTVDYTAPTGLSKIANKGAVVTEIKKVTTGAGSWTQNVTEVQAYGVYLNAPYTTTDAGYRDFVGAGWFSGVSTLDADALADFYAKAGARTTAEAYAMVADAKAALEAVKSVSAVKTAAAAVEAQIAALPAATAITAADAAAVEAAWEAYNDFVDETGSDISATAQLTLAKAVTAAKNAESLALNKDVAAYVNKTVTAADEAALLDLVKKAAAYNEKTASGEIYEGSATVNVATLQAHLKTLRAEAQAAVEKAINALPLTVAENDLAAVEAAQAAYDAYVAKYTDYKTNLDNLYGAGHGFAANAASDFSNTLKAELKAAAEAAAEIQAELEEDAKFDDTDAKAYLQDLSLKARSVKTAKGNVKVTAVADVDVLVENGYTVEYKFYRSTKSNKGFKGVKDFSEDTTYTNTKGTKGTKYYYKVVVQAVDAEGNVVAKTPLKHCLYASRTWTK